MFISKLNPNHHRAVLWVDHQPLLYITHQKPGQEAQIMRELSALVDAREPLMLEQGQVFNL